MYYAINDNEKIYLSKDIQMDKYLSKGYSIYEENAISDILVATPSDGYLISKPVFPKEEEWSPWKNQSQSNVKS
jgi:hypothetical protein